MYENVKQTFEQNYPQMLKRQTRQIIGQITFITASLQALANLAPGKNLFNNKILQEFEF